MALDLAWTENVKFSWSETLRYYGLSTDPHIQQLVTAAEQQDRLSCERIDALEGQVRELDIDLKELQWELDRGHSARERDLQYELDQSRNQLIELGRQLREQERELAEYRRRFQVWNILKHGVNIDDTI